MRSIFRRRRKELMMAIVILGGLLISFSLFFGTMNPNAVNGLEISRKHREMKLKEFETPKEHSEKLRGLKTAKLSPSKQEVHTISYKNIAYREPADFRLPKKQKKSLHIAGKNVAAKRSIVRKLHSAKGASLKNGDQPQPLVIKKQRKRPTDKVTWETKCSRNKKHPTFYNHTRHGFTIEETDVCLGDIFLLMFVQSRVEHQDRRDIIRRTYGSIENVDNLRVRVIFVLGQPSRRDLQKSVAKESQRHRDIVQNGHLDHYRNLTYTHLAALKWITKHCSQARFVLKLDDDTFVNLPHLVTFLSEIYPKRNNFIYCHGAGSTKPIRKKGFKWTVTKREWPEEAYPAHCKGFAYVMSRDIINSLLQCSYYLEYFWIDDVFVSGELRHRIGAHLQNFLPGFEYAWMMPHHATEQIGDYVFLVGRYNEVFKRLWQKMWRAAMINYLS